MHVIVLQALDCVNYFIVLKIDVYGNTLMLTSEIMGLRVGLQICTVNFLYVFLIIFDVRTSSKTCTNLKPSTISCLFEISVIRESKYVVINMVKYTSFTTSANPLFEWSKVDPWYKTESVSHQNYASIQVSESWEPLRYTISRI